MIKSEQAVVKELKRLIDDNGLCYLANKPYEAYRCLLDEDVIDRKTAGGILAVLVSALPNELKAGIDPDSLSIDIQRECCLNKRMSDKVAAIFCGLYSVENVKAWDDKVDEGYHMFLKEAFKCKWFGVAVWDAGNGTIDCRYKADIKLKPTKRIIKNEELKRELKENAFLKKEEIQNIFVSSIHGYLNYEFEEYCCCDDYYQPVVEDFEVEYHIRAWCENNGFEFISCRGEGYDEGYTPNFRTW